MPRSFHRRRFRVLVELSRHALRRFGDEAAFPTQHQAPALDLALLQPLPIMLGVLFKSGVGCEPSPHRARGAVLARVKLDIVVGKGGWVLREAVVEVFDVQFLLARDEREGDLGRGVEVKVPERAAVFGFLVHGASWQGALAPYHARYG